MDKVIISEHGAFGGRRIPGGRVSGDLWSDGVILAGAWTVDPASPLAGHLFTFRGNLTRTRFQTRSLAWRLEEVDGTYVDHYATRKDALMAAERRCEMDAFRELNRVEATR